MIAFDQIPLLRLSAKRALDSGQITMQQYQELMNQVEKALQAKKKQSDVYHEAIKQLAKMEKLAYLN